MTKNSPDTSVSANAPANAPAGVILATHADYGAALLRAVESLMGPVLDCSSLQVDAGTDVEITVARLKEAVERLDNGGGVIILTDMFGGTPTDLSLALLKRTGRLELVTGVNLPMLLKVFENRGAGLEELAALALEAGRGGIVSAGALLRTK